MYDYDRANLTKVASNSVVRSLLLLAKDHGAKTLEKMGGFSARFPEKSKGIDAFYRDAHMEYPGITKKFKKTTLDDGRVELFLAPRDAAKFEN